MAFVFPPEAPVAVPVAGSDDQFAVRRVYCVGRNYAAHAREMGFDPDREPPFFFCKPADAVVPVAYGETLELAFVTIFASGRYGLRPQQQFSFDLVVARYDEIILSATREEVVELLGPPSKRGSQWPETREGQTGYHAGAERREIRSMTQDTRKDPRAKIVSLNVRYKSATVDEFIENHSHDVSKGGLEIDRQIR